MLDIKGLLNNEKTLGKNPYASIDKSVFQEIDSSLDKARDLSKYQNEAIQLAEKDNFKDSSSIVLNYVVGYIKLKERAHEIPVRLNNIAMELYNFRNSEAADYVAKKILERTSSPKAMLVEAYLEKDKGNEEKMWEYYESYTKSTNDDTDIILEVADHYRDISDMKKAESYSRRALSRLNSKNESQKTIEAMKKLLKNGTHEIDYYISYAENQKSKSNELSLELLKCILSYLNKENENLDDSNRVNKNKTLDTIIQVSRSILELDSENKEARQSANDAFIQRFGGETRFADVMAKHDIISSEDPIRDIKDFITEISYSEKRFVQSKKNPDKIGVITSANQSGATVKFSSTESQNMKMDDLVKDYVPLTNQHIRAIRRGVPKDKIKEKINSQGGISWLIKTLLYSLGGEAQIRDMKSEVVPYILTESEWDALSKDFKETLKTDPYIKLEIKGNSEKYRLVSYETTLEEKQKTLFDTADTFYKKADLFLNSLQRKDLNKEDDLFMDMAEFFSNTLKKDSSAHEKISCQILLEIAQEKKIQINDSEDSWSFYTLTNEEKRNAFASIENNTIKKRLIDKIAKEDKSAIRVLESLFPLYMSSYIPSKIKSLDEKAYYDFIGKAITSYGGTPSAFVFFSSENRPSEEDLKKAGISKLDLIKNEIRALHSVSNSQQNQENRRLLRLLRESLLDKNELFVFLKEASIEDIEDVKTQILSGEAFEFKTKSKVREVLLERFPEIDLQVNSLNLNRDHVSVMGSGLLTTSKSYHEMEEELERIQTVDIPNILIDINKAAELGDLRENSEFKAAKEKKAELEAKSKSLKRDLGNARIVKKEDVKGDSVDFGTKVKIKDNMGDREIEYVFMGRWESDPNKNVIDISAPIGSALKGKRVGERSQFKINGNDFDFTILSIDKCDFE